MVYISSVAWDYMWQRPQQLAVGFAAEGKRVLYVEPPISILSLMKHPSQIKALFGNRSAKNVILHAPLIVAPIRMRLFKKSNMFLMAWSIKRALKAIGFKKPVIMICHAEVAKVIPYFKENLICFDCVDEASEFPDIPEDIISQENLLLQESDIVFVTAEKLLISKSKRHHNVKLVPNGADVEHFSEAEEGTNLVKPYDLQEIVNPIIGYYGAIASWIDFDMLFEAARRNPQWTFLFIGPVITNIPSYPANVRVLPPKKYEELPRYLRYFNICIIPFVINELTRNTNPIKMYEYLAAGKPVIATPLPEAAKHSGIVKIVNSVEEFENAIQESLIEGRPELVMERQKLAIENSWTRRCQAILKCISDVI